MKITYTGHAGLFIETNDVNILCDPWKFENPAFFGTWSVYPKNDSVDWERIIQKTDIVFVTHVHRDHFDSKFLTELLNKNKDVKVLVPDFRFCTLLDDFKELGFKNFLIKEVTIGKTQIVSYPSETIDREREDSCLCVDDGKYTFLNFNDSAVTPEHKESIFSRFGKIDWAAGQFSGANWWPACYVYDTEKMSSIIEQYKTRKIDHYKRMIEYLGVTKMLTTAGPPCFLQEDMVSFNYRPDNKTIFFDNWDVEEFNDIDEVYRILPGSRFTFNTIRDVSQRPFDKIKFIQEHTHKVDYTINDIKLNSLDNKVMTLFGDLLKNNAWLGKYIQYKVFINIKDYKCYSLDFRKQEIQEINELTRKGAYYIIHFEQKIMYELFDKSITDWEQAFLSCTCRFERNPDMYNPWIISFFRNLDNDRLSKIYELSKSPEVMGDTLIVGDWEFNRYCPHQKYDLKYHSKVDIESGTLQCLGHGWKWDLETCEGINCSAKILCKKVIRK